MVTLLIVLLLIIILLCSLTCHARKARCLPP
nr:MAG TPA: chitin synthase regulator [Crassvirales sp.]